MTANMPRHWRDLPVRRVVADASWARDLARFDAAQFGTRESWPRGAWEQALRASSEVYLLYTVEPPREVAEVCNSVPSINALDDMHPPILAAGGVSLGVESEILTLAVAGAVRGQGLGGALLDDLMTLARDAGGETMFLEVRSEDPIATGLYASRGFIAVGRRPGYYHGADATIMRCALRGHAETGVGEQAGGGESAAPDAGEV
ncbi:GNAT family N-acetyltransferase [Actinotignum sanguinis]|uniref:GNAT family N-acetyltransferase n=1 Tax=Actinotignum sanguinis TaxID=1445614 RepID=A0ABT5V803_9ACTO|nr:GNAT family N-acetyltransferase [Actinotignum sanguinis]MDE1552688.1 GNAT family N-acetyltransferase [Actinotignum sanguinis]MDE1565421.1 GNAT family N-acetyltransferase [Actinotignum sanguinis]MDE1576415.1 GNAT family N-acetyltransferase [Actinotignum sanguinis]MDE1642174.1 GNAT family N-acetyltransferase [Actinotignum sanguinis]MDE1656311.1 GNAT family N-acetyltransferase [Actinotignum sanguinis]